MANFSSLIGHWCNAMPYVGCRCGYVFDQTYSPLREEYSLIPEEALESAITMSVESNASAEQLLDQVDDSARNVLICPSCGRLYIESAKGTGNYATYVIEKVDQCA
jgi:hypothetical protein